MLAVRRLLVPVDFSPGSRAALKLALEFADAFGASGILLHVWSLPQPVRPDLMVSWEGAAAQPMLQVVQEQAERDMQTLVADLPEAVRARFSPKLEQGEVVTAVLSAVERERADLVIMGTHGRTGLSHLLIGSIAEKVVRRAPCPVLTVRAPNA